MEINPVSAKGRAEFYTFNPLRSGHGLNVTECKKKKDTSVLYEVKNWSLKLKMPTVK